MTFDLNVWDLAYDAARSAVWAIGTQAAGPDYPFRYDVETGSLDRWPLPETRDRGVLIRVVIDDIGGQRRPLGVGGHALPRRRAGRPEPGAVAPVR